MAARQGQMPSEPELYRLRAAECERAAAATKESDIRESFVNLAKQWRELAEYSETIELDDALGKPYRH